MSYDDDKELELLRKVTSTEEFFRSVLVDDNLQDWSLAREFGELLTRIMPDSAVGPIVAARACRHLGDATAAMAALARCRAIMSSEEAIEGEKHLLLPTLEEEERLLRP